MATSTIDTDTELSAVNSILGSIGQSPITTLNYEKPEIGGEDKGLTVKVMLRELEEILNITIEGTNLNKKENLSKLLDAIKRRI